MRTSNLEKLKTISLNALSQWEGWVHDQLDGTRGLNEAMEEVAKERRKRGEI